jgi:hypothetical protein
VLPAAFCIGPPDATTKGVAFIKTTLGLLADGASSPDERAKTAAISISQLRTRRPIPTTVGGIS